MGRTLLIVDDEAAILSALRRELRGQGYTLVTAESGKEGLQILAETEVQAILSDYRMPDMTGVDFLTAARSAYPDAVRMVLSGYADIEAITDAVNRGYIYKFLNKPWDGEQLREVVREAFNYYDLLRQGAQFSRIFDNTNEGIFIIGTDACIESINPAFSNITGYQATDLLGMRHDILLAERPGQIKLSEITEIVTRSGDWNGELWIRKKHGEVFPAAVNISVIRNTIGRVTQFVGLCTDITERKHRDYQYHDQHRRCRLPAAWCKCSRPDEKSRPGHVRCQGMRAQRLPHLRRQPVRAIIDIMSEPAASPDPTPARLLFVDDEAAMILNRLHRIQQQVHEHSIHSPCYLHRE